MMVLKFDQLSFFRKKYQCLFFTNFPNQVKKKKKTTKGKLKGKRGRKIQSPKRNI